MHSNKLDVDIFVSFILIIISVSLLIFFKQVSYFRSRLWLFKVIDLLTLLLLLFIVLLHGLRRLEVARARGAEHAVGVDRLALWSFLL